MSASAASAPKVLDKYMLPRVAFTVITLASMVGAALTGLRHGLDSWGLLALRWAAVWVMGLLLGSQVWKIFYLRPSVRVRPTPGAVDYGAAMLQLHFRWQKVLAPLAAVLVGGELFFYATDRSAAGPYAMVAALCLLIALAGMAWAWVTPADAQKQDAPSWIALAGLAATVAALGTLDVALQPQTHSLWLLGANRALHLWAFSAWLGGALWNIFIAVPAGMSRVSMDTVILANFQLERFRVVVRTVFPTIVATGLVQAWAIFGFSWQSLFTNTWGHLILIKLGLILVLVGVFIACPMWRACSPIRGVCNLDDL